MPAGRSRRSNAWRSSGSFSPEPLAAKRAEPEPAKKQPPTAAPVAVADPVHAVSVEEGARIQSAYSTANDERTAAVIAFFKAQGYTTWSDFFRRGGGHMRHVKDLLGLSEIPA